MFIWKHIESNVSTELYYAYQNWIKENKSGKRIPMEPSERSYSFLGLYQKYSYADLYEVADLEKKELTGDCDI